MSGGVISDLSLVHLLDRWPSLGSLTAEEFLSFLRYILPGYSVNLRLLSRLASTGPKSPESSQANGPGDLPDLVKGPRPHGLKPSPLIRNTGTKKAPRPRAQGSPAGQPRGASKTGKRALSKLDKCLHGYRWGQCPQDA